MGTDLTLTGRVRALLQNKEFERFSKFFVVGAIGAVIDFTTFRLTRGWLGDIRLELPFGLALTGVGIAGIIAFTLAVISNFIWNRYWTYPDSRSKPLAGQLVQFFAVNIVGIVIRVPLLELLSPPLGRLAGRILATLPASTATGLGESAAWAIAVVIVLFWNFFVNRYWTYNDVE